MAASKTQPQPNSSSSLPPDKPILLLIDGHALIYRAYHAFPDLTDPQGRLVNAVYGFSRILLTSIREFNPEYLAVCLDSKEKTIRAQLDETYKAHRPEMPDDLQPQIPLVEQVVDVLGIPRFAVPGYEADDLIGTITTRVSQAGRSSKTNQVLAVVVTGDKDLLQLVDDQTHVFIPGRGRFGDVEYDSKQVKEAIGLRPDQIVDLKALMGDASDNIKGVAGVGKKTATRLLGEFETLDKLYAVVDQLVAKQPVKLNEETALKGKVIEKLLADRQSAYLSQELARIAVDTPIRFNLEASRVTSYNKTQAAQLFEELNFISLKSLLPQDEFEIGIQDALF